MTKRRISLALQGGGAHGAFTWGVLDRLLEEQDLEIAGISGTSAGALNGAALKAGMLVGGQLGAKHMLDRLWDEVAAIGDWRMVPWLQAWLPLARLWQETAEAIMPISSHGLAAQLYSPYAWGSAWQNPLGPIVDGFDFSRVCATEGPRLFVSATNVRTGKIRVFKGEEITPAALMASACVPTVFQAVVIDGESYWDGGYAGNPALFPLYEPDLPDDIIVVSINPLVREEVPETPLEIQNRINEISFNSSLLSELRAISFVKRLIAEGRMERGIMKDIRVHMIADDRLMNALTATTKLAPSPHLIAELKAAGRGAAEVFLAESADKVGQEPTVNLKTLVS
ncbi:patatin-like phospholipase family protein [Tabrizicola sp.]|uniref:patatin-like phospholipase family protein n=1 Tax=Tabrizicola sp. TaxID=2005166 RepID=UPI00286A4C1F|nr:patatin-like phospholipase family protein [Tabrizicola sp.]